VDLGKLSPEWISPPGRWGVGVSFLCPVCVSEPHRIFVWFRNPTDGDAQLEDDGGLVLHTRDELTSGLSDLTLLEPLLLPCWEGVIVGGSLLEH
jgi:hypothetical protein